MAHFRNRTIWLIYVKLTEHNFNFFLFMQKEVQIDVRVSSIKYDFTQLCTMNTLINLSALPGM